MQLSGVSRHEYVERGRELKTRLEQVDTPQNVQAETSARQRHHQTTHVTQMAHVFGAHQRQYDEVVLLALVFVDRGYLVRLTDPVRVGAAFAQHVANQMLLAIVRAQYGDLVPRVADQTHVHVNGHRILGLGWNCRIKRFILIEYKP